MAPALPGGRSIEWAGHGPRVDITVKAAATTTLRGAWQWHNIDKLTPDNIIRIAPDELGMSFDEIIATRKAKLANEDDAG